MSTTEESLLSKVANRDRKIGHLEEKLAELVDGKSQRSETVSVWVCVHEWASECVWVSERVCLCVCWRCVVYCNVNWCGVWACLVALKPNAHTVLSILPPTQTTHPCRYPMRPRVYVKP